MVNDTRVCCAEEPSSVQQGEEEEVISTQPEAVMEYMAQLLAIMQDKAEARGGVAVLGESLIKGTLHLDM